MNPHSGAGLVGTVCKLTSSHQLFTSSRTRDIDQNIEVEDVCQT